MRKILHFCTILFFIYGFSACNPPAATEEEAATTDTDTSKDDEEDEEKDDESAETEETKGDSPNTVAGTLAISTNNLAAAYPEGLTINAYPQALQDKEAARAAPGSLVIGALRLNDPNNPDGNIGPGPIDPNDPNAGNFDPNAGPGGGAPPMGEDGIKSNVAQIEAIKDKLDGVGECFGVNTIKEFTANNYSVELCFGSEYGIVSGTVLGSADGGGVNPALETLSDNDQTAEGAVNVLTKINGFAPNNSGEVCMVAVSRQDIDNSTAQLRASLDLLQGVLCQAKKAGVEELPDEGDPALDLTDVVVNNYPKANNDPVLISGVKMTRLPDQDGNPIYQTEIDFTRSEQNDNVEAYQKVTLVHSPEEGNNENYKGTLFIKGKREENNKVSTIAKSMTYVKTTKDDVPRLVFDVRSAHFPYSDQFNQDSDPFAAGRVNFSAGELSLSLNGLALNNPMHSGDDNMNHQNNDGHMGPAPGQGPMGPPLNNSMENGRYIVFDVNPLTNAGKIASFTEPGGAPTGFVSETVADPETGKLAGCAWAGTDKSSSLRARIKANEAVRPTGCFTSQISNDPCGNSGDNQGDQVWKQCFKQDDTGVYVIDTAETPDDPGYEVIEANQAGVPNIQVSDIQSPLE